MVARVPDNESLSSEVEIPAMESSDGGSPHDDSALVGCEDTTEQTEETTEHEIQENINSLPRDTMCCSITKKVFEDAVVHPQDGVTYERLALIRRDVESNLKYYPNRALMAYIHLDADPHMALFEEDIFVCPITMSWVRDPVIDPEGNTYERSAIVGWIKQHGKSPITRNQLQVDQLYDNTTLFMLLVDVIQQQADRDITKEESDAITRWKQDMSSLDSFIPSVPHTGQLPAREQAQTQVRPPPWSTNGVNVALVNVARCTAGAVGCCILGFAIFFGSHYILFQASGQS